MSVECSYIVASANRPLFFEECDEPPRPGAEVTYMGRRFQVVSVSPESDGAGNQSTTFIVRVRQSPGPS